MPDSVALFINKVGQTPSENLRSTGRELIRRSLELEAALRALRNNYTYQITSDIGAKIAARQHIVNASMDIISTMIQEFENAGIDAYIRARDLECKTRQAQGEVQTAKESVSG